MYHSILCILPSVPSSVSLLERPALARIGPSEPWRLALASRRGVDGPILRKANLSAIKTHPSVLVPGWCHLQPSVKWTTLMHALQCGISNHCLRLHLGKLLSMLLLPDPFDYCFICRCHRRNCRQHICLGPRRSVGRSSHAGHHPTSTEW